MALACLQEEGEGGEGGSHTGRLGKAMVDAGSYWRVAMAMAPLTALRVRLGNAWEVVAAMLL